MGAGDHRWYKDRVAVNDGVVTLSGYVDSYMEKVNFERAAARIFGVKVVVNEIKVNCRAL